MTYNASKVRVFNRGVIPDALLNELLAWGKTADDALFAQNTNYDIYNKVFPELGPYSDLRYRKAVMLHVMAVLAMFEASGKFWNEGVDSSRRNETTNENAEAGMWQVSWNNRKLDPSLREFLSAKGIDDGATFRARMASDTAASKALQMEFIARLLRIDVKDFNRINNGPVRKVAGYGGLDERKSTPWRQKFWSAQESIYPWLSRAAVTELVSLL